MLYIVEFIVAVLVLAGVALYGVFALNAFIALVLAIALAVWLVRIQGAEGIYFVAGGFLATALVVSIF